MASPARPKQGNKQGYQSAGDDQDKDELKNSVIPITLESRRFAVAPIA
jgi:hypothetical protein